METTLQTIEAYYENQEHFVQMNGREKSENELIYHLRQIHRLLYIFVNENENEKEKENSFLSFLKKI